MILENCDEKFLFFLSDTKYIDIICCFVIFLCVLLCIVIKNKNIYKSIYNNPLIKINLFLAAIVFLLLAMIIFAMTINENAYEGCYCKVSNGPRFENKVNDNSVADISFNKVIVIGDSRMELIEQDKEYLDIPVNFHFIAKSGAKIDWFEKVAINKLENKLDNIDDDYTYHVVINMGVNDLTDNINIERRVLDYFDDYKRFAEKYPYVNFYLLSVNPIDDKKINNYFSRNKRSNIKIETFNKKMNYLADETKLENIYTCDSYHSLSFSLPDGLHYNHETDQKILDYITNKCVMYK